MCLNLWVKTLQVGRNNESALIARLLVRTIRFSPQSEWSGPRQVSLAVVVMALDLVRNEILKDSSLVWTVQDS